MCRLFFLLLVLLWCSFMKGYSQTNILLVYPDIEGCIRCDKVFDNVQKKLSQLSFFYDGIESPNWKMASESDRIFLYPKADFILTSCIRRLENKNYKITFLLMDKEGELFDNIHFVVEIDQDNMDSDINLFIDVLKLELDYFIKHDFTFKTVMKVHDFSFDDLIPFQVKLYSKWLASQLRKNDSLIITYTFYYFDDFTNETKVNLKGHLTKRNNESVLVNMIIDIPQSSTHKSFKPFIIDLNNLDKNKDSIVIKVFKKLKSN